MRPLAEVEKAPLYGTVSSAGLPVLCHILWATLPAFFAIRSSQRKGGHARLRVMSFMPYQAPPEVLDRELQCSFLRTIGVPGPRST
jgi:hypothetical protein